MKTHTGSSVPCKACGKKFGSKVQMLAHYRVNHEGYNFSCPHCPAKFIHRSEGICSFSSEILVQKYPFRSQMSSHLVREHNEARKYACEFCGQRFIQKGHCNRHIKQYHRENEDNFERIIQKRRERGPNKGTLKGAYIPTGMANATE